ncbi:MAG: phosphatase PAP2 family protein [Deltaproteobacteria bacterium]|nr:phosphatase PAP2 family protein [Deltaproteobacteria bacterium]
MSEIATRDDAQFILLGFGTVGALAGLSVSNIEPSTSWESRGPTLLAGKGLPVSGWKSLSDYGFGAVNMGVAGYYVGQVNDDPEHQLSRLAGYGTAMMLTFGTVQVTKIAVGRERPDRSDNKGFFSGHTAFSFASSVYLSTDLIHTYGSDYPGTVAPVVALSLGSAALVGLARNGANKHYWEDIVTGAAVGSGLALASYYTFVTPEERHDTKHRPSGRGGAILGGLGIAGGVVASWISETLFSDESVAVLPSGSAETAGLTVAGQF